MSLISWEFRIIALSPPQKKNSKTSTIVYFQNQWKNNYLFIES